jgi:hypothetical protein
MTRQISVVFPILKFPIPHFVNLARFKSVNAGNSEYRQQLCNEKIHFDLQNVLTRINHRKWNCWKEKNT